MYDSGIDGNEGAASLSIHGGLGSQLTQMLMASEIVPGTDPGYALCKTIHSSHPLGAVLADAPITRAQSKPREINVPVLGEERIVAQFNQTWRELGKVGATVIIHNLVKTSRIYGISSLAVGERGKDTSKPLDLATIADSEIFFNVLDPLNTAGSLVLNQDPNSPDFLKPDGDVRVNGQAWHPSRLHVKMNEQPIYIQYTNSAFGFVGRSIYQRALFPLRTFLQTMITDQMVTQKAGLLVAKMKTPGSFIDNVMTSMFGWKRAAIKAGVTNQVLQIGTEEDVETLNMQNLDKAAAFARTNVLKNIATAAGMPASIIAQETLTEGFGEGTEDAKKEVEYLEYIREDMQPVYDFVDRIVMRRAWTSDFYEALCVDYTELRALGYETWLHKCMRAFKASWPNMLIEPDSEKIKTEEIQFKSVIAFVETIAPLCDPETKSKIIAWAADNCNARERLFASTIDIDQDALQQFLEENRETQMIEGERSEGPEGRPRPFAAAS